MGVDYFSCDYCGRSICDCGHYEHCNEDCYRRWCNKNCAEGDGFKVDKDRVDKYDEYLKTCKFCRKQDAEDAELLEFLLEKYSLTREEVVKDFFAS
jgi:hypothetical protein